MRGSGSRSSISSTGLPRIARTRVADSASGPARPSRPGASAGTPRSGSGVQTGTIRVLHARSAYGKGPIQSSVNICRAMAACGAPVRFYASRIRTPIDPVPHTTAIPALLSRFYTEGSEAWGRRRIQRRFLRDLRPGDVAWLYPTVDLWVYEEIRRRGLPIIMEGVNARMAHAEAVLRPEYAALGQPYGYTDAGRIAEEERMLACATHFFVCNPVAQEALTAPGSGFRGKVLVSRHGAHRPSDAALAHLRAAAPPRRRPRLLYSGTLDIRKATHLLLRAWAAAAPDADLVLCGWLSPQISEVCAQELALPSVHLRGHVQDMAAEYAAADAFVMPSLEEGGPKATAEAAAHGLPLVVSRAGGTWFWEDPDAVLRIDPHDTSGFAAALGRIAGDAELRARLGARARAASAAYDWGAIGRQRAEILQAEFPGLWARA